MFYPFDLQQTAWRHSKLLWESIKLETTKAGDSRRNFFYPVTSKAKVFRALWVKSITHPLKIYLGALLSDPPRNIWRKEISGDK